MCWGLQCTACSLRPALVVLLWPASCGPLLFVLSLFVLSRVPLAVCLLSAVGFPWLLCSALLLVFGVGPAWPALPVLRSPPALPAPLVSPLVPSGPVSALLVPPSGYLVVFATARLSCFACCVVTVWHLSSLLFMATKASALCGAPPSTPCCVCCFGAPPSCTEVFTLSDPDSPSGRR